MCSNWMLKEICGP